jgi:hypothetical protein
MVMSIGAAGSYLVGGNANVGVAMGGRGFRLFANAGATTGLGLSTSRASIAVQKGSLEDFGSFSKAAGGGDPIVSVGGPVTINTAFKAEPNPNDLRDDEHTFIGGGFSFGFGGGAMVNFTDAQKSTPVIP